jgi:hypothetical protein
VVLLRSQNWKVKLFRSRVRNLAWCYMYCLFSSWCFGYPIKAQTTGGKKSIVGVSLCMAIFKEFSVSSVDLKCNSSISWSYDFHVSCINIVLEVSARFPGDDCLGSLFSELCHYTCQYSVNEISSTMEAMEYHLEI